jgi:hypothetical protein
MNAFDTGITGALALFAPRRMGKTEFILLDLAVEAESRGYQVAYCSFWNLQDNPAKALRLALDGIKKSGYWREKWHAYTESISSEISAEIGGANVKLKSRPSTPAGEDELLEIINLLGKLSRERRPTLLLLDEVQHLSNERFASLVATLRTQFDEHRKKLHVVYTGSSRDGLQRMFRDRKAPMFHAAQQVDFPDLDSKFVAFMLQAFEKASQRKLSLARATQIFNTMNRNPALFHHLLRHMVIKGIWDIKKGYENFQALVDVEADHQLLWDDCKPIDKAVLKLLVQSPQFGLYTEEARSFIGNEIGTEGVSIKEVQNAVKRLRESQVLYSPSRGEWLLEDPQFRNWILSHIGS